MKVNAEKFLDNIEQYKYKKTVFFVTGNEESLINKVKNKILNDQGSNSSEIKTIDLSLDKKLNLAELTHEQSLFNKKNILQIKSPNDSLIKSLDKINDDNCTIVISGENIKNNSKIKKYFDLHKKFYSIVCYKLTKAFKKKLVDKLLIQNNCKLLKDAYWFFIENSSDEYQMIENEVIKISNYGKANVSITDLISLSADSNTPLFEDLFFQCIYGNNQLIITKSKKSIRSSADAYYFLQIAKNLFKILISTSEKKNKVNIKNLTESFLPKYLFRQKSAFELAIVKANLDKMLAINSLIQKTELYLRKNDSAFLIIIQRFLLNFSKVIK